MTSINLNDGGVAVYPSVASFPTSAADGALAVAQDVDSLYEFNGSAWILIGPGGGGGGTVTDVTASAPLSSTGGSAPNISIPIASSSLTGALSSTDWNIFNSKTTNFVNQFILDSTDISNKFVTLTQAPDNPTLSVLDVIGGITQQYSVDYSITGTTLSWSGTFLDGVLIAGDVLIVQLS